MTLSHKAQTGFEPVDTGVADHCLTTWLLRHNDSDGNRTRVTAVKGRCLNRLTTEPYDYYRSSATRLIYHIMTPLASVFFIFFDFIL